MLCVRNHPVFSSFVLCFKLYCHQLLELYGKLYVSTVRSVVLVVFVVVVSVVAAFGYCYRLAGAVTCQVSVFRGFSVSSRSCWKLFCIICKQSTGSSSTCQKSHRDSAYDNLSYTTKHFNICSLYVSKYCIEIEQSRSPNQDDKDENKT